MILPNLEIVQIGQSLDFAWNTSANDISVDRPINQEGKPSDFRWNGTSETVVVELNRPKVCQNPNLGKDGSSQLIGGKG